MKTRQKPWHLVLVALALATASLALGAERKVTAVDDPKTVTVTEKQKDGKVALDKGDLLVVRLESTLGDGYLWKITGNKGDSLKVLDKAPGDKVGKVPPSKYELQVYYLRAQAPGTVDLQLEYCSKTDKDAKPAMTYKVTVEVK